jgi:glutamyl-tRNA reductase
MNPAASNSSLNPIVMHSVRDGVEQGLYLKDNSDLAIWKTCLREIAFLVGNNEIPGHLSHLQNGTQDKLDIFHGINASQFLLEIVCGLKSPVTAETEVHGQFREFYKSHYEKLNKQHKEMALWCERIDQVANQIRDQFLRGLGSQSYGSYARKKTKGLSEVHVLGSGHLTREILPWLIKSIPLVHVYYRNEEKSKELAKRHPQVILHNLAGPTKLVQGALLVTAPLSADKILDWLGDDIQRLQCVLDYRSESEFDPIPIQCLRLSLKEIFADIEGTKTQAQEKVVLARKEIAQKSKELLFK